MRKIITVIATVGAALAVAGVAIATTIGSSATPVSTSFQTAKQRSDTRICVGADGDTYQVSSGRYAGTATGGVLAGPIEVNVRSVYNQTDKLGVIEGWIRFTNAGDRRASAFSGILGDSTTANVNGWVAGRVLGNVVGLYTADTSFNGTVGNGERIPSNAVVLSRVDCKRQKTPRPSVKLEVKGEVDALSATEISVKPKDGSSSQKCAIKAGVSPSTNGLVVKTTTTAGSRVEMKCGPVDNVMTLLRLSKD
jgi:hypothetical protein